MSEFFIRDAEAGDHADWLAMVQDYDPDIGGQAVAAWERIMNPDSGFTCVIAVFDGRPVAFMQHVMHEFFFTTGPVCYLSDLYVHPDVRRQGIARFLLQALIEEARDREWARVYWVTEHGNPARTLYDKFANPEFVRYHLDLGVPNAERQIRAN